MPSPIRVFSQYLTFYKKHMIIATLLGIVSGGCAVTMTLYIGKAIDTMIGEQAVQLSNLVSILGLLIGITTITSISQWLIQIIGNKVAYYSVAKLRQDAFYHLNQLPLTYYDQTPQGDVMSRFTNDLDYVSDAIAAIFNNVFSGMTIVLISLISMLFLSPILTSVVVLSTLCIFIVNWIIARMSQRQFQLQQETVGQLAGFLSDTVSQQKLVKAFQYEPAVQSSFTELNHTLQHVGQKAQFVSSLTNPLSRFVDHLGYLSIGVIGGILVINQTGHVTIGMISSFIIYSSQFSKPFIELSGIMTQIQTAIAGLKRIVTLMSESSEQSDASLPAINRPIQGRIDFEHVDFSYQQDQPLIKDFNLTVLPGETVAIVGKTGAGKSTLVNLLMRFYDVDKGVIRLDHRPISDIPRDDIRQAFGMVLQDTWLFNGTIWDNLTFGRPDASMEDVIAACQDASIYHFIQTLPDAFQTIIGQTDLNISDGQKQLLTIARTMISQPPMLILDEATSSVDTLTESHIQQAFLKMMTGRTSFVIAHRLSTIQDADKILVMEKGQVVEIGLHQELLDKPNGYYYTLYHAQFKHS